MCLGSWGEAPKEKKCGEGVSAFIYQRRRRVGAIKKRKWRDINLPTTFIFPPPPFNSRGFINCLGKGGLGGRAFFQFLKRNFHFLRGTTILSWAAAESGMEGRKEGGCHTSR